MSSSGYQHPILQNSVSQETKEGIHFYGVLFCLTGHEVEIAQRIERNIPGIRAISPEKLRRRHVDGKEIVERTTLFPGYVFIKAPDKVDISYLQRDSEIIRQLYVDSEKKEWHLIGVDRLIVKRFFDVNGVVSFFDAYFDQDNKIHFISGVFNHNDIEVIKVNRRAKTFKANISLLGKRITVWLGYIETHTPIMNDEDSQ